MLGEEVSGPHALYVCSTELMQFQLLGKSKMEKKKKERSRRIGAEGRDRRKQEKKELKSKSEAR